MTHIVISEVKRLANEIASDYPNLVLADPLEQLYAIKQTVRGVRAANSDLHDENKRLQALVGKHRELLHVATMRPIELLQLPREKRSRILELSADLAVAEGMYTEAAQAAGGK